VFFDPHCFDNRVLSVVSYGRSGNFGDVSIEFGFIEDATVFIFPWSSDGRLVVTYLFNSGGRNTIDFSYKSEDSKIGNVASNFCSVGANITNATISGTETFNENSIMHIGYKPSLEALAV
jgi:hypothetical protein